MAASAFYPRVYKDVNTSKPKEFWNFVDNPVKYGNRKDYAMVDLLQNDWRTGVVFRGYKTKTREKVAVKLFTEYCVMKSRFEGAFKEEIAMMELLKDSPNVVKLLDLLIDNKVKTRSFVYEYIDFTPSKELYPMLDSSEVQFYAFESFKALDFIHSKGIIHRGIKPDNILIDHQKKQLKVIDFGISKFYVPAINKEHLRFFSGNLGYKAPEVLLIGLARNTNYHIPNSPASAKFTYFNINEARVDELFYEWLKNDLFHNYAVDLWSMGCVFADMIFKMIPFFEYNGYENFQAIFRVLGFKKFVNYVQKYDIYTPFPVSRKELEDAGNIPHGSKKQSWKKWITSQNEQTANAEALDLLEHLLVYDHDERYTAQEALAHPYFSSVADQQGYVPYSSSTKADITPELEKDNTSNKKTSDNNQGDTKQQPEIEGNNDIKTQENSNKDNLTENQKMDDCDESIPSKENNENNGVHKDKESVLEKESEGTKCVNTKDPENHQCADIKDQAATQCVDTKDREPDKGEIETKTVSTQCGDIKDPDGTECVVIQDPKDIQYDDVKTNDDKDSQKRGLVSKSCSIEMNIPVKKLKNEDKPENNEGGSAAMDCEAGASQASPMAVAETDASQPKEQHVGQNIGDGAEDVTKSNDSKNVCEVVNEAGAAQDMTGRI